MAATCALSGRMGSACSPNKGVAAPVSRSMNVLRTCRISSQAAAAASPGQLFQVPKYVVHQVPSWVGHLHALQGINTAGYCLQTPWQQIYIHFKIIITLMPPKWL